MKALNLGAHSLHNVKINFSACKIHIPNFKKLNLSYWDIMPCCCEQKLDIDKLKLLNVKRAFHFHFQKHNQVRSNFRTGRLFLAGKI